jgi:nucleoid-associated protein YgaU
VRRAALLVLVAGLVLPQAVGASPRLAVRDGAGTAAVPAAVPAIYRVKAGDTLGTIATAFFGDATASTDIYDANREQLSDPNSIRAGQILIIPQHVRK